METPIRPEEEKRRLHKQHFREFLRICDERERLEAEWQEAKLKKPFAKILRPELPDYPDFPEACRGLTCGAKTRAGTPCKRKDLYENGRCRLHGGLSTGPVSKEGKRRSALNGFKPKKKKT